MATPIVKGIRKPTLVHHRYKFKVMTILLALRFRCILHDMVVVGLRERKKAQTRKRLAEVAYALFQERGFDGVTVAEIADASDVAVSTLFAYFPSKEALIFDDDDIHEKALVSAVRERAEGVSILDALEAHLSSVASMEQVPSVDGQSREEFKDLINRTPRCTTTSCGCGAGGRRVWRR